MTSIIPTLKFKHLTPFIFSSKIMTFVIYSKVVVS